MSALIILCLLSWILYQGVTILEKDCVPGKNNKLPFLVKIPLMHPALKQ